MSRIVEPGSARAVEQRGRPSGQISAWGIVSLALLVLGNTFGEYNLYVYDRTGRPPISFGDANQILVVVMLVSIVCGIVAMRRGSTWWGVVIALGLLSALIHFFGDL